jgi:hypothetical protein
VVVVVIALVLGDSCLLSGIQAHGLLVPKRLNHSRDRYRTPGSLIPSLVQKAERLLIIPGNVFSSRGIRLVGVTVEGFHQYRPNQEGKINHRSQIIRCAERRQNCVPIPGRDAGEGTKVNAFDAYG